MSSLMSAPDARTNHRKRIVRTLRFLLILAVIGAAYPTAEAGVLSWRFWLAAGLLFASNLAYHFEHSDIFQKFRLSAVLFLFDSAILAYMMVQAGERSNEFFVLFALSILMAAIARSIMGALLSTVAVAALYTMLTLYGKTGVAFLSMPFLTRMTLLFVLSIFVAYLAGEADQARHAARGFARLCMTSFELNPAYLFLCDREGRILMVNRAVEQGLGYPTAEILGRPLTDVARLPDDRLRAMSSPDDQSEVESLPVTLRRRDGREAPGQGTLAAFPSPTGTLRMLTAHEESAELRQMREAVQRSERLSAVGQLVAGTAHELNNALTSVIGYADLLGRQGDDSAAGRKLRLLSQEGRRAAHIVRNLLVFSRRQTTHRAPFLLNDIVSDILDLKRYAFQSRGIRVEWSPAPDLPPLVGDSTQIGQVVLNLLNNAEQAIESHQAGGTIHIRSFRRNTRAVLEVSDNGPGIPPGLADRLFEPFVTSKPNGTGLGLSVCRSILRGHGGDIAADPHPGPGATFRIEIPVPAGADTTSVRKADDPLKVSDRLRGIRFLVVDDDPGTLAIASDLLQLGGAMVDSTTAARGVLDAIATGRYDVVLCDICMPVLDGRQLYALVKERAPGMEKRFVFMTGDLASASTRHFLDECNRPCLEKPFDARAFYESVESVASHHATLAST